MKSRNEVTQDFIVERVFLVLATRVANMKVFYSNNKRITHISWKNWKDEQEMKQSMR